jgi:hypothetical protein
LKFCVLDLRSGAVQPCVLARFDVPDSYTRECLGRNVSIWEQICKSLVRILVMHGNFPIFGKSSNLRMRPNNHAHSCSNNWEQFSDCNFARQSAEMLPDTDETEQRLIADLSECGRQRAVAEDKITNPGRSMLYSRWVRLRRAADDIRTKCDAIFVRLAAHRKARRLQ